MDALRRFSDKIARTVVEGKREGLLRSAEEVYTRYPTDDRSIQRVTAEDLIEEQPEFAKREDFPPTPTAILRLSKVIERENEIQQAVWQAITILRLFRIGSIRELSYTHETESYFALGGTLTTHRHHAAITQSVIGDEDVGAHVALTFSACFISLALQTGGGRSLRWARVCEIIIRNQNKVGRQDRTRTSTLFFR